MKPIFIELTNINGNKFKGNLLLLERYGMGEKSGYCFVVGWNNNGSFDVRESYEEITKIIEKALK